jgi:FMN-dependent NADH-azoreductase
MKTLLRIDSSLRFEDSYSRNMGDYFVQEWQKSNPNGRVEARDVTENFIPHLNQQTVYGFYDDDTIHTELLNLSDRLIDELYKSDEILITAPMYNFGIPSSLKAYFDLVVRTEKTFVYYEDHRGLVANKKAYIITAMGDIKDTSINHNLAEIHLQKVLNYIGINDTFYFSIEGTANKEHSKSIIEQQKEKIKNYLKQ